VLEAFFSELLPEIDHLGELKLTIYIFWRLNRMEGQFRYLTRGEIANDNRFMHGLSPSPQGIGPALDEALSRAVKRGTLLTADIPRGEGTETLYFLNTAKGRDAVKAIANGEWRYTEETRVEIALGDDQANIFELYEQNFGPLTPMIADALREAEQTYPAPWIEDAMRIAVENNARNWRYVAAILDRWQVEGRHDRKDRRDSEKDRRSYVEGEFADYIEH
jgi:DnaD/phage-associated family protein